METAIIFHLPSPDTASAKSIGVTIESIFSQTNQIESVLAISTPESIELPEEFADRVDIIKTEGTLGMQLNIALEMTDCDFIMHIDNRQRPVILARACLDMFLLGARRNGKAGMLYGDYALDSDGDITEIHLLSHHIGRVRDNQDFGPVLFIRRYCLDQIGGFDETLEHATLYDLRMALSVNFRLIRLANKYEGSLYRVLAGKEATNVFDYLLAGKDAQLEAEKVLTTHLKEINAYLPPGFGYRPRIKEPEAGEILASVVIPVNNRPEFIATAIESVQAQTIPDVEAVIVVNGGEDDKTIPEVQRYQDGGDRFDPDKPAVQLVVIDINNIGFSLNMGLRYARGHYYVQLDSDDRLKPNAVEKILAVFQANSNAGMVIGSYEVWEKKDDGKLARMEDIPVVTHDEWTPDNGRNNLLRINGAGAPRSIPIHIIREMVYFAINDDPHSRNYGEDYEMVLHISEKYEIDRVYEPIYEVIRHSGGTDHNIDQVTVDRNDEAKDWMRRLAVIRRQFMNKKR